MPGSGTICLLHLLFFISYVMSQTLLLEDSMIISCPGPNNTASSSFISNLRDLVNQKLHNEGGKSPYQNTSYGENPDTVYGFYLCKFNVSSQSCQNCIVAAGNSIMQKCHGTKEATIWYNECMVRYSDHPLLFMKSTIVICNYKLENLTVPDNVSSIMTQSFRDVVVKPSLSSLNYATVETKISSINRISTFGQCLPVLSSEDCRNCVNRTVGQIPGCFLQMGTGFGRIVTPDCNIGYEIYPFSGVPTVGDQVPLSSDSNTEGGKSRKAVWIAIGTTVPAIIVVVLFGVFVWHKRRRQESNEETKPNIQDEVQLLHLGEGRVEKGNSYNILGEKQVESQDFTLFPLDMTLEATRHFSLENKLGEGGFGPVYKGILADGKAIAVKRLSTTSGQGLQEFKNEVSVIAKLQHKNLVRLLGCCLEGNELLLIYEYMPNKSLDIFLFDSMRSVQLDWQRRKSIINGIARGILYLHEDSRLRIIHRDLKASNVLLDHEMNPKISDFGMARIFGGNQSTANTKRVVGTYGYMAPEYAMEGLFSVKSDVFSFGVLVLEIISGRRNSGFYIYEDGQSLLTYTWKLWCEENSMELMDPVLKESYIPDELLKCIHIGLLCVQEDPADRPTMSSVLFMLASDTMTLPEPTHPPFSVSRSTGKSGQSSDVNEVTLSNVSAR